MRPMDFEEFLWSVGEEKLASAIRAAFEESHPLPAALRQYHGPVVPHEYQVSV